MGPLVKYYQGIAPMIVVSLVAVIIIGLVIFVTVVIQPNGETGGIPLLLSAGCTSSAGFNKNFNKTGYNMIKVRENSLATLLQASIQSGKYIYSIGTDNNSKLLLSRLILETGLIDTTFGNQGFISTPVPGYIAAGLTEVLFFNNKILAFGGCSVDTINSKPLLIQYNLDGTLDVSFGTGGIAVYTIPGTISSNPSGFGLIENNTKIVLIGANTNLANGVILIRVNLNGSFDTSLNGTGYINLDTNLDLIPNFGAFLVGAFLVLPNNQMVASCIITGLAGVFDFGLLRLNYDGTVDTTFGTGGAGSFVEPGGGFSVITSCALQGTQIVCCGYSFNISGAIDAYFFRFNSNGTLDTTFGTNGWTVLHSCLVPPLGFSTSPPCSIQNITYFITVLDNYILATGSWQSSQTTGILTIIRLLSNGKLDTNFGSYGVSTYPQLTNPSGVFAATSILSTNDSHYLINGNVTETTSFTNPPSTLQNPNQVSVLLSICS